MLLPYKPWHLDMILASPGGLIGEADPGLLDRLAVVNLAMTIVSGDKDTKILGIVGAGPLAPGIAEVFVVVAAARDEHPCTFARDVRRILEHSMTLFGKLEAACPEDDDRRRRFLEWLGFTPTTSAEGMLRWAMEGVRA